MHFFNYIFKEYLLRYKGYFALIKVIVKQIEGFCGSLIYVQCSPSCVLLLHSLVPIFVYGLCIYKYEGHLKEFDKLICVEKWNACCLGSTDFPAHIC